MQKKLAAGFLMVALLYILIALAVPRLGLAPGWRITLIVSLDLVLGLGAAWLISRRITRRMRDLAAAAADVSRGDLSVTVDTGGNDEIAEVARAFVLMADSLADIVREVRGTAVRIHILSQSLARSAGEIDGRTAEIAAASEEIAGGAGLQAEEVSRAQAVTMKLSDMAEGVARRTGVLHATASEASVRAGGGAEETRRAAHGLERLAGSNLSASRAVEGFREKAEEIGKLVNSITAIAHQTHLLAINAAIEAARAGAEGRGFGAVAEEVGLVADNVRGFADQISTLSDGILSGSQTAAEQRRRTVHAAEELGSQVERSLATFEGILAAVRGTADSAGEILELTQKHRNAAEEAVVALHSISRVATSNVRGTEEAQGATRIQTVATDGMVSTTAELAAGAEQLHQAVSVFRLPESTDPNP
jgi:methyl-accepting chemotaxis protein